MDYGKVFGRAWEITWRWKVLWILGFLASLGSGGGGSGSGGSNFYSGEGAQSMDPGQWLATKGAGFWTAFAGVIAALICVFFLIAVALWVISIIARGGLIAGVQQVEDEGNTSFRAAWRVGVQRFWTLFGVAFLAALPALVVGLVSAIVLVLGIVVMGGAPGSAEGAGAAGAIVAALCCGGLCCGLIPLTIVLEQIRTYAERAAVLDGLGWIDAFKRGWQVIRQHLGPTVILWFIFLAIGLVFAVVALGLFAAAALPFIAVLASTEPQAWMIAPACCAGLLLFIVLSLASAIVQTFTSATWTLAYRELTGSEMQPAAEVLAEA